ncbi:MAG: hypothetical protein HYZ09_02000, partial [Candidatus Kerfeldbacteria bacterium]|nr:hypothetical protein [Candidatus Kerfeldbacteria bacterium]
TIVVGTVTFAFQPTGQFTATLYWLSLFFVGAFLAVFQYAAWTILLVRLRQRGQVSKLTHWANLLSGYLGARKT